MEIIKEYSQTKFDKQKKSKNALTTANVKLYRLDNFICLFGEFN